MNRICNRRTVVATLALLCAIASGTAVAKSTWTLDAKALMYPGADPVVELPSVDGSGWKMLHGNQATHQVSYATSGETLDPLSPSASGTSSCRTAPAAPMHAWPGSS